MVQRDAILSEFENVGVSSLSEGTISKCLDICDEYDLSEEDLAEQWVAFSASHLGWHNKLDEDILARMVAEMEKEKNKALAKTASAKPKKAATAKPNLASSIPSGYVTPQRAKPVSRLATENDSPVADFSPASYSPAIFTPSGKKTSSANSGKVVCELGATNEAKWKSANNSKVSVQLLATGTEILSAPYKHMFEPQHLTKAIMADRIDLLGQRFLKQYDLQEFSPINEQQIDEAVFVGRVACDAEDSKLTSNSAVLVGAADNEGEISLSLQKLQNYSLFSGQVVALKAHHAGEKLVATQVLDDVKLKFPEKKIAFDFSTGPMEVVVASGPFTHSDSLTYEPLQALVKYVQEHQPHLLILCGPFIDSTQQCVQDSAMEGTYDQFFFRLLNDTLGPLSSLTTKVVIVSSTRDVHHSVVYPSPPFTLSAAEKKVIPENVTFVSDPCLLDVDGMIIGVTSTDVLKHLGPSEISNQSTDRLGRLASHVLRQACFYPVYPPVASVHLEAWEKFAQLPVKPHVMVLPSDLRFFVKNVDDSLVVNPERLAKGVGGGTFARLEIVQPSDGSAFSESVRAQVVKI